MSYEQIKHEEQQSRNSPDAPSGHRNPFAIRRLNRLIAKQHSTTGRSCKRLELVEIGPAEIEARGIGDIKGGFVRQLAGGGNDLMGAGSDRDAGPVDSRFGFLQRNRPVLIAVDARPGNRLSPSSDTCSKSRRLAVIAI